MNLDYWNEPLEVRRLTSELRKHDKNLFIKTNRNGVRIVYEMGKIVEYFDYEGMKLGVVRSNPKFVFALTDNWTINGRPVEWGLMPLLDKLRESDMALNHTLIQDLEKQDEEIEQSKKRDRMNQTEAFLYDFRNQFKKTFSDYNVSTLDKRDKRKQKTKKEL